MKRSTSRVIPSLWKSTFRRILLPSALLVCAASAQAIAHDYYYVVAKHSNKCLHQHGATQGNGDAITQWSCVNQPNVKLELRRAGGGYYFLKFKHSEKCVHQHGATFGDGDPITQWQCVNQPNVKIKRIPAGGGYYWLQFQHSGKCVHQHGGTSGNGDAITQWACINQPNVLWRFVKAPD
ncbi:RICIN domain-containing protein [Geminicoccus harenae]|uniref:RICIN domain-containing protein n=1 Tax=Geminicoccus harenae TaxID=2498453 RepID=UPI00168AEE50|nr:RICIN domain-containing protein [Geminicoccus harenae]